MSNAEMVSDHYDERYFARQVEIGTFGGWANQIKFQSEIKPTDDVLDFGCGSGFLLKGLTCASRSGIEINPAAIPVARKNGVTVYTAGEDAPEAACDVIGSNHALEHTLRPLDNLKVRRTKLKVGGKLVLVVPCEGLSNAYRPGDINNHLYTWNPMTLGNLLTEAGFQVRESKAFVHKWPMGWRRFKGLYFRNRWLFDFLSRIRGQMSRQSAQVRVVAIRAD